MNRAKKKVTVSFFAIEAADDFFRGFVSSFKATKEGAKGSRVLNLRSKKHLIKAASEQEISDRKAYAVTLVKERNTWQAKATSDGKISGISLNQGIIGDPYFFLVIPRSKLLLGFTSGPSGSLRGVAKVMLEQFNSNRSNSIRLEFVPKEEGSSPLHEVPSEGELHLRIGRSAFAEIHDDTPDLIRELGQSPLTDHEIQLVMNLDFSDEVDAAMSRSGVLDLINYFSDNDGCSALRVKGTNDLGEAIRLNFGDAFFSYQDEILTRNKFIDEKASLETLQAALREYLKPATKLG